MVLVVVNRLSKYVHFMGLAHPCTGRFIVWEFQDSGHLHGIPRSIANDRDLLFLTNFWIQRTVKLHRVELKTWRGQAANEHNLTSRGQAANEHKLRSQKEYLVTYLYFFARLSMSILYSTGWHASFKTTPFKVVYL